MEQVKEPIKLWNSISEYSAELNRTTGMHGSLLHSIPKTLGRPQQQRKPLLTFL